MRLCSLSLHPCYRQDYHHHTLSVASCRGASEDVDVDRSCFWLGMNFRHESDLRRIVWLLFLDEDWQNYSNTVPRNGEEVLSDSGRLACYILGLPEGY